MNADAVAAYEPPIVLIVGPFDPSGASSLPADAVTCAALGCHAASAVTASLVRDSAHIEDLHPVGPEWLDDQIRCILEDMAVRAIKIGPLYTTETVSVIAQIAADYSNLPLLVHAGRLPYESLADDVDAEDAQQALFELLLPQTDIVVASASLLDDWLVQGLLPDAPLDAPARGLLGYGSSWVLSSQAELRPGQSGHILEGQQQQARNWPDDAPATGVLDADGPLACAITCGLALGQPVPDAVEHGLDTARALSARSFQPGMGQRLFNRTFQGQP